MWNYEKKLQYPVNIKNSNPAYAKIIISQLGGANRKKIYPLGGRRAVLTGIIIIKILTYVLFNFPFLSKNKSFEFCAGVPR